MIGGNGVSTLRLFAAVRLGLGLLRALLSAPPVIAVGGPGAGNVPTVSVSPTSPRVPTRYVSHFNPGLPAPDTPPHPAPYIRIAVLNFVTSSESSSLHYSSPSRMTRNAPYRTI